MASTFITNHSNIGLPSNATITNGGTTLSYATNWVQPYNTSASMTIAADGSKISIDKKAALEVKGKLMINGLDLEERLKTIEKVLAIPERDAIMEAKYPSLKKKFDEYINALEKYRTFERLKGNDTTTS